MSFSRAVRQKVLFRSSGLCERWLPEGRRCLAPGAEFHHIVPKGMGGRRGEAKKLIDSEANCMLVCLKCHRERHEGHGWNEDADKLIPLGEIRRYLKGAGVDVQ